MKKNPRNLTRLAAIFAIVCAALLAGCSSKAAERMMKQENPESEIARIPGESYSFLIRDKDGKVWYAESTAFNQDEGAASKDKILIFK